MMIRILFFAIFSVHLQAKPLQMDVRARAAVLMNADTQAVLYEKQADLPAAPGSITKIAVVLFALDAIEDLKTTVRVSQECLKMKPVHTCYDYPPHWLQTDGTMLGLKKGEEVSYETLLHGMMLVSGNDAANAVAENCRGSIALFMEDLNRYLASIGCRKTRFCNPHGLHHPEHKTTAYDMCLIATKALQHPRFNEIGRAVHYTVPRSNRQKERVIRTLNPMLRPGTRYYYPKVLWGKTGYTDAALNTLVTVAEQDGRRLVLVLLGCETTQVRFEEAKRIFETAFAERKTRRMLFLGTESFIYNLEGAKAPLEALMSRELSIDYYPSEEPEVKAEIHWEECRLPIRKGQKVAEMQVIDGKGQLLAAEPLFAKDEVKATVWFAIKERWKQLF